MEIALQAMTQETTRLLRSFREARGKMERASARDELTEALCLLPPAQRAFDSSMLALRARLARIPEPECAEPKADVPEAVEFPPIDNARRVPVYVAAWFCGAIALALMASFVLGYVTARG